MANLARLAAVFGVPRVERMLMLAEVLAAEEALDYGFLLQIIEIDKVEATLFALCEQLGALAPATQSVTKEGLRRLASQHLPEDEHLIRQCYGSDDFREGVVAFVGKRRPVWRGT